MDFVPRKSVRHRAAGQSTHQISERIWPSVRDPTLAVPVNAWLCCVQGNNAVITMLGISVQQGFEPRPAGAPARVHTCKSLAGFCPTPCSAGRARIRPGKATILFLCEQRKSIKKKSFSRKTAFCFYSNSVVQLAAWMALSVSRSSRERASAFLRYSGTEMVLQILISERVARRVRLLAEVRKFR